MMGLTSVQRIGVELSQNCEFAFENCDCAIIGKLSIFTKLCNKDNGFT